MDDYKESHFSVEKISDENNYSFTDVLLQPLIPIFEDPNIDLVQEYLPDFSFMNFWNQFLAFLTETPNDVIKQKLKTDAPILVDGILSSLLYTSNPDLRDNIIEALTYLSYLFYDVPSFLNGNFATYLMEICCSTTSKNNLKCCQIFSSLSFNPKFLKLFEIPSLLTTLHDSFIDPVCSTVIAAQIAVHFFSPPPHILEDEFDFIPPFTESESLFPSPDNFESSEDSENSEDDENSEADDRRDCGALFHSIDLYPILFQIVVKPFNIEIPEDSLSQILESYCIVTRSLFSYFIVDHNEILLNDLLAIERVEQLFEKLCEALISNPQLSSIAAQSLIVLNRSAIAYIQNSTEGGIPTLDILHKSLLPKLSEAVVRTYPPHIITVTAPNDPYEFPEETQSTEIEDAEGDNVHYDHLPYGHIERYGLEVDRETWKEDKEIFRDFYSQHEPPVVHAILSVLYDYEHNDIYHAKDLLALICTIGRYGSFGEKKKAIKILNEVLSAKDEIPDLDETFDSDDYEFLLDMVHSMASLVPNEVLKCILNIFGRRAEFIPYMASVYPECEEVFSILNEIAEDDDQDMERSELAESILSRLKDAHLIDQPNEEGIQDLSLY